MATKKGLAGILNCKLSSQKYRYTEQECQSLLITLWEMERNNVLSTKLCHAIRFAVNFIHPFTKLTEEEEEQILEILNSRDPYQDL